MNSKKIVLAIIPARGGSKGLPRKNVLPLSGKPLISHTILAAKQCEAITELLVNTDDDEIAAVAAESGVRVQRRPEAMGNDVAKVDELLVWSVKRFEEEQQCEVDIVVLLYPTAPLRPSSAITGTIEQVTLHGFDSALTLVEDTSYLWIVNESNAASPTNYDPRNRAPRQTETWNQWRENKAVYAVTREVLISSGCRLGSNVGYFPMTTLESIDIDSRDDMQLAEAILERKNPKP